MLILTGVLSLAWMAVAFPSTNYVFRSTYAVALASALLLNSLMPSREDAERGSLAKSSIIGAQISVESLVESPEILEDAVSCELPESSLVFFLNVDCSTCRLVASQLIELPLDVRKQVVVVYPFYGQSRTRKLESVVYCQMHSGSRMGQFDYGLYRWSSSEFHMEYDYVNGRFVENQVSFYQ
ncbi:MAG: hypothetical protein Aurels2KO_21720 [Aureliella sp.]